MSNDKRARSVFSERLRMLRKSNNLTQKQVAQSLSIDRSTYAYYEIDKTKPDYDTLLRISRIFNVSVDFLLGRDRDASASVTLHDNHYPRDNTETSLSGRSHPGGTGLPQHLPPARQHPAKRRDAVCAGTAVSAAELFG